MKFLLVGLMLLLSIEPTFAQSENYERGHQALQLWDNEAMALAPQWVRIWLMIMGASFAIGLFFVWRHPIARWVVGGFIAAIAVSGFVAPALGIVGLSGFVALVHLFCWSPALYQLLTKRPFLGDTSAFSIWSGVITAVILFSFIFDIRDAFIYLQHILS